MDFGKLPRVDHVDFRLPPIPKATTQTLARSRGQDVHTAQLLIGAPAWARRDWLGRFYPKKSPSQDLLALYAQRAPAIELNATFYNLPKPETIASWAEQTPATFQFCPKVHQWISHDRGLRGTQGPLTRFFERFAPLGTRLGPFFVQLPPWLGPRNRRDVVEFVRTCPDPTKLMVEFRHEGWFASGSLDEEMALVLEEAGVGTVVTDVAGRRDVCHLRLTNSTLMVRFVGNDHESDAHRVENWMRQVRALTQAGLSRAYFFVHLPDDVNAPELMALASQKARTAGIETPAIPLEAQPSQMSLL